MIIVFCPPLFCLSTLLSKDFLSSRINVAHSSIYQSCSAAEQRGQLGDFCRMFFQFSLVSSIITITLNLKDIA